MKLAKLGTSGVSGMSVIDSVVLKKRVVLCQIPEIYSITVSNQERKDTAVQILISFNFKICIKMLNLRLEVSPSTSNRKRGVVKRLAPMVTC